MLWNHGESCQKNRSYYFHHRCTHEIGRAYREDTLLLARVVEGVVGVYLGDVHNFGGEAVNQSFAYSKVEAASSPLYAFAEFGTTRK